MSLSEPDSTRFLGMDVSQWPRQWRAAARLPFDWPVVRWLVPQAAVRLQHADGRVSGWQLLRGLAQPVAVDRLPADAAHALELPSERVLERQLTLPPLAPDDLARAVNLDVAGASPFAAEQTVWGYAVQPGAHGLTHVHVAMASRAHIDQALQAAGWAPDVAARETDMPEIWVLPQAGASGSASVRPVILRGWGESRRQQRVRRGLHQRLLLLGLMAALLAALVVTPTAFMRAQARQASQSFGRLQAQAGAQLAEREALMQRLERLQQVARQLDSQLALPPMLDVLSRSLPDGAWLTSLRVDGNKLTLNGQADDAAALVQVLAAEDGAHNVRLASPATRRAGANKETFIIELQLDTALYGHSQPADPGHSPVAQTDAPQP